MEDFSDSHTLIQIITILEEMLFSIPMPIEVVKKYENMRENATNKTRANLPASKIWALQKTALERQQHAIKPNFAESEFSMKVEKQCDTIKKYQSSLEAKLHALEKFITRISTLLAHAKLDHQIPRTYVTTIDFSPDQSIEYEDIRLLNTLNSTFEEKESCLYHLIDQVA